MRRQERKCDLTLRVRADTPDASGAEAPSASERPGYRLFHPSAAPPLRSAPPQRATVSPLRRIAGARPARRPSDSSRRVPPPLRENFRAKGRGTPKDASASRDGPGNPKAAGADPGKEPADREPDLPPEGAAPKRRYLRGRVAPPRRAASLRGFPPALAARNPEGPRAASRGPTRLDALSCHEDASPSLGGCNENA